MAEPMDELTAIEKGYARETAINQATTKMREGYHVVYSDGYESWCPKINFEQSYKSIESWVERAEIERAELLNRYGKLFSFIGSEKFNGLPFEERRDLMLQATAMEAYVQVLNRRIERRGFRQIMI